MSKRVPPTDRIFQAFDVHASFEEGSLGRTARRIIDFEGAEQLDRSIWDAGLLAYDFLKSNCDDALTREGYGKWVASANAFLAEDFYPDFLQLVGAGSIGFSDGTADDFHAAWEEYDWVQKFDVLLGMLDHARSHGASEPPEIEWLKCYTAAALLRRIDDAVISAFMDGRGLIENVVDIISLRDRLKQRPELRMTVEAAMGAARKEIGKAGAAAKLAKDPKQVGKAAAREYWEAWQQDRSRYKGVAAFARDMLQKFESLESQQVIERWCRAWAKETQQAK